MVETHLVLTFKNVCASFNPVLFLLFCCFFKYTRMCLCMWHVGQCICMCLCVFVYHLEETQFYYDSNYSKHHSYKMPYSEEVMVFLCPPPTPKKQKCSLRVDFFFSHIFIHRRANTCAHKANQLRTLKYFVKASPTFAF